MEPISQGELIMIRKKENMMTYYNDNNGTKMSTNYISMSPYEPFIVHELPCVYTYLI